MLHTVSGFGLQGPTVFMTYTDISRLNTTVLPTINPFFTQLRTTLEGYGANQFLVPQIGLDLGNDNPVCLGTALILISE